MSPLLYFHDAVLRAPTIGCMLMCMAAALIGVIVLLRKQSLLGESLSHSAYPGVIIGVIVAGVLEISDADDASIALLIIGGAFFSAILGLTAINFLQSHLKVHSDAALCFVLSSFFGIGLTLASNVQFTYTSLYRQVQVYLYGQAATMTDIHIFIYGFLTAIVIAVCLLFYKEIQVITFDRIYAKSLGINTQSIDLLIFLLIVSAVVIGIRSVGVVLMSAMLIAPAVAARQYTNKLSKMFVLASIFGLASGFFGNYLSVEITQSFTDKITHGHLALPTGPMIVVVASSLCLLSLMLAPERGLLLRLFRANRFRQQCMAENILKAIWRRGSDIVVSFEEIAKYQSSSSWVVRIIMQRLIRQGWVVRVNDGYRLSRAGSHRASRIVRLHRLWEVYLVDYLGIGTERVHHSAEEMEHILTPEIERELTLLLQDPKRDPHDQPIPPKAEIS